MEDLQKIKEFFSKPLGEIKKDESGNHLEPQFKKGDKVTYLGNPGEITGVNKEMTGAYTYNVSYDKGKGKTKATNITNKNGTDIKLAETKSVKEVISTPMDAVDFLNSNKDEITKLADQFKGDPVSMQKAIDTFLAPHLEGASDFIVNRLKAAIGSAIAKRNIAADPKLSATYDTLKNVKGVVKEETGIDTIKKKLDALGVKYEMSKTDKVRPFKVIYKPVNKSDEFYDKFNDIVDLANLKGVVKSSMNEAEKEDAVDTITMDVPLFIRMLEYSREDAKQDLDLHDVTEKANKLGKEKGILSMEDYDAIVGAAEEIKEVNLKQSKLSSAEYQKAKKLKDFKASDWKWNADEDLYTKVNEGELTEANVPSNIKDFAKRKGISSLVNKVAGWAEKVGARIAGGTAIGKNYSTLVLDLDYKQQGEIRIDCDEETIELYDEPVYDFKSFQRVYIDGKDDNLEEKAAYIAETIKLGMNLNEELCEKGKRYIASRQAAGEKSSAYLSGRAVRVCKGQIEWPKKGKKK